ncbi:hypothetical protein BHU62_21845 [Serratia marcescens]|uniref:Integrase DNA-binding domain-containing protein n=1 Tax=Serratia marcescens TaxID=615 RepID=A0A1Q4NUL3_SERMA|nr:hypothetical protein BHU62_21845 [Serratia marcescens]
MQTLGIYPAVSLYEARQRRYKAKWHVANGVDPGEQRKVEKQARKHLRSCLTQVKVYMKIVVV